MDYHILDVECYVFYKRKPHIIGRITWLISSNQASMTLRIYIEYVWNKTPKKRFELLNRRLLLPRDNEMLYEIDERYFGPVVAKLIGLNLVKNLINRFGT